LGSLAAAALFFAAALLPLDGRGGVANGELIDYDLVLEPVPTVVKYSQFYVRAPGGIDLSHVLFKSTGGGAGADDDAEADDGGEGDDGEAGGDDGEAAMMDKGGGDGEGSGGEGGGEANGEGGEANDEGGEANDEGGDKNDEGGGGDEDGDATDGDDTQRRPQRLRRHDRHFRRLSSSISSWSKRIFSRPSPPAVGPIALPKDPSSEPATQVSRRELGRATIIDIAAFPLPSSCVHSINGCDWTSLGLGAKHDDGTVRWCCTAEAQRLGMCLAGSRSAQLGRIIIDRTLFKGESRSIQVPGDGTTVVKIVAANKPKIRAKESGMYALVLASCSDGGRPVMVNGTAAVRSSHGYLPGELYGFMFFFAVLTVLYFVLVLAYGFAMHLNEESRIPIEKWILATIVLGLLEMTFRLGDVYVWNEDGYQQQWIALVGAVFGVMKQGWSRCLLVTVSLGWGVTRDTLGRKLKWIVVAGLTYVGVAASRDVSLIVAVDDVKELSQRVETELFDLYTILTFVLAALDVLFAMWILDSLASTMEYLESMKQSRKLARYIRLRCLFLFAILFALVYVVFAVITSVTTGIVAEEDAWLVDSATEMNYFVVLVGVAILWRPNPSAREYAYAMELPSMRDDGVGGSELELTGTVPSAMDSFDDEDDDDDGFQDAITPPGRNGTRNGGYVD
jgi:hypothetical protein